MDENASTGVVDPNLSPTTQVVSGPKTTNIKKKGIVIGVIIACVLLIIGIIIAVILAKPRQDANAVEKSLEKLWSFEERNIQLNGTMNFSFLSSSLPISELNVDWDMQGRIAKKPQINNVAMAIEFKLSNGNTIKPSVNAVVSPSGDLYIKLSGLADSFSKLVGFSYEMLPKDNAVVSLIDKVEEQWLLITPDDVQELLANSASSEETENTLSCMSDYMGTVLSNENWLAELYKKHPYIVASQDNMAIASKANPLYRITFDKDNLIAFSNDLKNTEPFKDFANCVGAESVSLNDNYSNEVWSSLPYEYYVEIDNNYDITRFYAGIDLSNNLGWETPTKMVGDFDVSYPDTVNTTQPDEYTSFRDVFGELMQGMSTIVQGS